MNEFNMGILVEKYWAYAIEGVPVHYPGLVSGGHVPPGGSGMLPRDRVRGLRHGNVY